MPAAPRPRLTVLKTYKLFIGGKFPRPESGRVLTASAPSDHSHLAHYARGSKKDLRDAVTAPGTDGIRRVDTSKSILVGAFLVSSYWITEHYSETALGLYLGAWVINGGAVLLQKVLIKPQQDTQSSTTTVTTQSKVTP